jgi:hypothetical protein
MGEKRLWSSLFKIFCGAECKDDRLVEKQTLA